MANTPSGPEAIVRLEAATEAFEVVITTEDDFVEVPNKGPTPSLKKRVNDGVEGNIQRAETAATTAVASSGEAGEFARRTSVDAATARQISGLDTVDQALAAREPSIQNATLEALSGGMVRNRLDANGNWNVMVRIPKFTNEMVNNTLGTNWTPAESVHPAFIRPDGTTMDWFEVGMYQASNDGSGNPVSLPYKDPYASINYDSAKTKCQSMGAGFGLMSNAQWAAITLWCLMSEYQPTGNTYYGRSHDKQFQSGVRQDSGLPGDSAGPARTLTGSGPDAWRHIKSMFGIAGMVGNVWEWVDGLKINEGQFIVADRNTDVEADWIGQAAYFDIGNKLNSAKTASLTGGSVTWSQTGKDASYVPNQLLQQLMIEPLTETGSAIGRLYYNNDGERFPLRGGSWLSGSSAGLAAINLNNARSNTSSLIGFRPAYFE